jgi:hypothetical protein
MVGGPKLQILFFPFLFFLFILEAVEKPPLLLHFTPVFVPISGARTHKLRGLCVHPFFVFF